MPTQTDPILYIGDRALSSWSLRAWLVLARAGAPFEARLIPLDQPESKGAIALVSPARTVPVLHDGDVVVWDSLAIAEWAHERAPEARLWPEDPSLRALARAVSASQHAGFADLRASAPMSLNGVGPDARVSPAGRAAALALEALWRETRTAAARLQADGTLALQGPFLLGAWSIADAMATPYATRLRDYRLPMAPDTSAYVEALLTTPEFLEWEAAARLEHRREPDPV